MLERLRDVLGEMLGHAAHHADLAGELESLRGVLWKLERSQVFREPHDTSWQAFHGGRLAGGPRSAGEGPGGHPRRGPREAPLKERRSGVSPTGRDRRGGVRDQGSVRARRAVPRLLRTRVRATPGPVRLSHRPGMPSPRPGRRTARTLGIVFGALVVIGASPWVLRVRGAAGPLGKAELHRPDLRRRVRAAGRPRADRHRCDPRRPGPRHAGRSRGGPPRRDRRPAGNGHGRPGPR